jgi:sugar phosphate isomerase/epimerase
MVGQQRIRIGNQTAISAPSLLLPFEYAVQNGFDAFEWFPDKKVSGEGWTEQNLSPQARHRIGETAQKRDISLSVHASLEANPLDPTSTPVFDQQIEFAREIGASLLNVHADFSAGIEAYARAIALLSRRLNGTGIRLSIENTPRDTPEAFNQLFYRLRSQGGSDLVGMCLDIGHANLCDSTRNNYLRYMDRLDSRLAIIHVHLHENYGNSDSHLPLFTGPASKDPSGIEGFIDRLVIRAFAGSIVLEQWPQPPELLRQARERLLLLLKARRVSGTDLGSPEK